MGKWRRPPSPPGLCSSALPARQAAAWLAARLEDWAACGDGSRPKSRACTHFRRVHVQPTHAPSSASSGTVKEAALPTRGEATCCPGPTTSGLGDMSPQPCSSTHQVPPRPGQPPTLLPFFLCGHQDGPALAYGTASGHFPGQAPGSLGRRWSVHWALPSVP